MSSLPPASLDATHAVVVPEDPLGRPAAHRRLLGSALIFALGTMMSRVLGLFRDILIARYVPTDARDAFINAFRLPNLFRRLLGEGSLSVSFIPVFVDILRAKGPEDPHLRRLVGGTFSILLAASITISLLAIVFMEELLHILLDGSVYMNVPGKFELTVQLARIMFGFLVLISLYGYFMAILNSLHKFAMAALAPCLFNIAIISGTLLSSHSPHPERGLSYSILVGGFLQFAILIPQVWKAGFMPRFSLPFGGRWQSEELARVFRTVVPSAFSLSFIQLTSLVNMRFAASLPSGSHSFLYFADRLLELPVSLLAVSVGSVLLPTLSHLWAERRTEDMAETMNAMLRLVIFLALPAAVGLSVLAQPITETLFLGKQFTYESAVATAGVVRVYAGLVLFYSASRIIGQGFYAAQRPWYPALAAGTALVSHVVFGIALTRTFGLTGLATAAIFSSAVNFAMLAIGYSSRVGALQVRKFIGRFLMYAICAAPMGALLMLYGPLLNLLAGHIPGAHVLSLAIIISGGAVVYMAVAFLIRLPEASETIGVLRRRRG